MRCILLVFIAIFITTYSFAQNAGARIYTGLSVHKNASEAITPTSTAHLGQYLGLDARLSNSRTSFLLGAQFARIPFIAEDGAGFFKESDKVDYFKGRLGFDVYLFPINDYFKIRGKILGNYYMVFDYDGDKLLAQGNGRIAEGMVSGVIGLGVDILAFTIDLEYDHGFQDAYEQIEGSTFNSFSLAIGFHF